MNNYERLLAWARSHGAIIPSDLVFLSTPYGHCQSTTPIAPGTALFHIPHTLLITPSVADTALPQLHSLSVHARVCTFLALERRKHGFWKEYLDSLPQTFETPAYFTEEELNVLRGTNLFFAWRDRIDLWKEEYRNVEKIISDINWHDYLWAATVLSSRSFPSRLVTNPARDGKGVMEGPADPSSSDPILIPVMDMLNHRPNHPVTWLTSATQISFVAETAYPANTEIFNNYGAKGNEELLMGYGFCIPNNPYNSLSLRLPNDPTLYTITRNNLSPDPLLSKFCQATQNKRDRSTPLQTGTLPTKRNLYAGYTALLNALLHKLSILGWDDRGCDTPAGRYAEMYRQSQRELLVLAYMDITGRLAEMERGGVISSNEVVWEWEREGGKKRRKREVDVDRIMVQWLARTMQEISSGDGERKISDVAKKYVESLGGYYSLVNEDMDDEEEEEECRRIQKKLRKRGHEIDMKNLRLALTVWRAESIEILQYPAALEVIEQLKRNEDAREKALRGEAIDIVLFVEETSGQ